MVAVMTLSELVDLALGTPEVGCVNYNALHLLLHGILTKLNIADAPVQLGHMIATEVQSVQPRVQHEDWGSWIGSQPSLAGSIDNGGKKEIEGRVGQVDGDGGMGLVNVGRETPEGGIVGGITEADGEEEKVVSPVASKGKDKEVRGGRQLFEDEETEEFGIFGEKKGADDDEEKVEGAVETKEKDKGTRGGPQVNDEGETQENGTVGAKKVAATGEEKVVGAVASKGKDKGSRGGPDKGGPGKGLGGTTEKAAAGGKEKSGREGGKAAVGGEAVGGRKGSGAKGRGSQETDSIPLIVHSMPFHELAKKVEKLEEAWQALNELPKIDPFGKSTDEKGVPLHDMWETLQFQKRLDANTEGVDRLMGLVQDILHRLQKLAENDAEQMALITGSHQKLASLAPKADFDAVKDVLSSISGKVDSLHDKEGLVTWENLETALKGSEALLFKGPGGQEEREGSPKDADEFEMVFARKDGDEVEEGVVGNRDEESGKGATHGGKADGTSEHPGGKGQESRKRSDDRGGKRGSSDSRRSSQGEAGSRRESGSGKGGPSPDLQSVLGSLGKLDEKFRDLLAKVSAIEHNLDVKDIFNLSADAVKKMSDGAIAIESTRDQVKDVDDELSRSYLEPLRNANEIIATLIDTVQCPNPSTDKEQRPEDSRPTGRKSLALGALEKTMKLVDRTFGVLQRAFQNLDCKLTNQTIKWDEKLKGFQDGESRPATGSRHLISSPSIEDESCKEEEPEVVDQSVVDSQTRLKELEKKLGLRKDEMCQMTKRLNQLNKAVSQQLNDAKDRLNDLESRLSEMTCDLTRLIQKIEAERGQYAAPAATMLDASGMSSLIGVQNALADLKADMERLSGKTDSLQQSNAKHQDSIDNLVKLATELEEKKTDKADLLEKATKQDMDLKLDSRVFESTCDELTKNVNSLLGRVSRLDQECKNSFDKLTSDLAGYMTAEEFDRIRDCMAKQFKVLAKKLVKMQKQLEIAKLVGDDAAGIRRQLFKCLSCDRPILMASLEAKPALPSRDGLFPYRSTKPYTTYELEQIRQHARCFQIPKGLSNYERAVIERQLSRMKIRDLRGNTNSYWRQDHPPPSSPVKHIRTNTVSPNSQGDAIVTTSEDAFPDPYACTRPCGGSHTLTSPYKRVIHMADLNTIITNDEQSGAQQNQDNNNLSSSFASMSRERSPVTDTDDLEDLQTITPNQDKSHVEMTTKTRAETRSEGHLNPQSQAQPSSAIAVAGQPSDDSGRRFSDPSINAGAVKKPELKFPKSNVKPGDRRISAPNTTSTSSAPNATYMKKRRFSTPVNMMVRDQASPSAQIKKSIKENEVMEEDDKKEEEEEEKTHTQSDTQQQ